jgi:hypothetical protein
LQKYLQRHGGTILTKNFTKIVTCKYCLCKCNSTILTKFLQYFLDNLELYLMVVLGLIWFY